MLTAALTVVRVVPGYRLPPKCVYMTFLFTVAHHREQSLVNQSVYPVMAQGDVHHCKLPVAELPLAYKNLYH